MKYQPEDVRPAQDFVNKALCIFDYENNKMKKLVIAFDVDGVLITDQDKPIEPMVVLLKFLSKHMKNTKIIVWSGGGAEYAHTWATRLRLDKYVWKAGSKLDPTMPHPDIAFDDQQAFSLADKNVIVRMK